MTYEMGILIFHCTTADSYSEYVKVTMQEFGNMSC